MSKTLPFDPETGRYGHCTGHVEQQGSLIVYVHPADCPLHPSERQS